METQKLIVVYNCMLLLWIILLSKAVAGGGGGGGGGGMVLWVLENPPSCRQRKVCFNALATRSMHYYNEVDEQVGHVLII